MLEVEEFVLLWFHCGRMTPSGSLQAQPSAQRSAQATSAVSFGATRGRLFWIMMTFFMEGRSALESGMRETEGQSLQARE
jgi:hypothetical protein